MLENVIAIIVVYMPDDEFFQLLSSMENQFRKIIVCNNGLNSNLTAKDIENFSEDIEVVEMYGNKGIAYALNRGIERVVEYKAEYVAFFDQDSALPPQYTKNMIESFEKLKKAGKPIGILSPLFYDEKADSVNGLLKVNRYWYERKTANFDVIEEVVSSITSGSIMPMWLFERIGRFIDDLFIDYVDNEFCMRAYVEGYRTYVNTTIIINHSLGDRSVIPIGKLRIKPTNHKPFRKFYITRNRIYCLKRYGLSIPGIIPFELIAFAMDTVRTLVFEKQKLEKAKNIFQGIVQGFKFHPVDDYKS